MESSGSVTIESSSPTVTKMQRKPNMHKYASSAGETDEEEGAVSLTEAKCEDEGAASLTQDALLKEAPAEADESEAWHVAPNEGSSRRYALGQG